MKLASDSFRDGGAIPGYCAFAVQDPKSHIRPSQNRNPHLAWTDLPKGTRSVVLICHDPDVPSRPDDVNQEGRSIPASLPRVGFCHWVLIDMPASGSPIRDGEFSSGVTAKGKQGRSRRAARARASMTTPPGSQPTRTWRATITATTAPARRGTIRSRITTSLRFTLSTSTNARCSAGSAQPRC